MGQPTDKRAASAEVATRKEWVLMGADAPLFGYGLLHVGRQWRRVVHLRLAEMGLTDAAWVPLIHLYAAGNGLTLKALAARVGLDSSTLVRVVDMLEGRGLLVRETDVQDRRSKQLQLTPAGLEAVADVRAKLEKVEAQLLAGMQPELVKAMQEGIAQLSERVDAVLQSSLPAGKGESA